MKRFAAISDIHGNRWALEAVLADIDRAGIKDVVNLGDVLYGPLDPAGTAELLIGRRYPTISGNEDRIVVDDTAPLSDTIVSVREQLDPRHMAWLESLPTTAVVGEAFLCHGAPGSDTTYLLWEVEPDGARQRESSHVSSLLSTVANPVVLCGHDHVPQTRLLDGGRLVVDPGSVGLPAYDDDHPHPHIMATGTPHARYAVLSRQEGGWSVEHCSLSYDWQAAAETALSNGRPDWAAWLRTGCAEI